MTCNSTRCNNTFRHIKKCWPQCTLGHRNQIRFHWNRDKDNAPQAKTEEFDSFTGRFFAFPFLNLQTFEGNERSASVIFYNFSGIEVRTFLQNSKTFYFITHLSASFLRDFFFQIGLAISNDFLSTVISANLNTVTSNISLFPHLTNKNELRMYRRGIAVLVDVWLV